MFNKETEYAIQALVYIQRQNRIERRPGIEEITREIEAPRFFVAKILQRLAKAGFVGSQKGKGGGFYFDATLPPLPLKTIIHHIEGSNLVTGCGFGLKHCNADNPCPLHHKFEPIRSALNDMISTETIQSLALKNNPLIETL